MPIESSLPENSTKNSLMSSICAVIEYEPVSMMSDFNKYNFHICAEFFLRHLFPFLLDHVIRLYSNTFYRHAIRSLYILTNDCYCLWPLIQFIYDY